jgi:hypothetical protein
MMRQYTVHLLRVDFKYHLEDNKVRLGMIYRELKGCWAKTGMHGKATVTFIVVTRDTSTELQRGLGPTFEQMGSVENHWCFPAPTHAVARHGIDPFVDRLADAWQKAREWNKADHVGKTKWFGTFKR